MIEINTERLLDTFLDLVQIDSPSRSEAAVAAYCSKALKEAGCVIRFDETSSITGSDTGNLFATLAAFGQDSLQMAPQKPIFFSAHMDTVNPCLGVKPHIEDGIIYSDGTTVLGGDDKAGLAAIIEMIRCLKEAEANGKAHPEIRVLFSVQEELSLVGAKAMDAEEFADVQGALCYVLDAAGKPGLVINGAPHHHSYYARYSGLAAHAGMAPNTGISAIRAAGRAIAALPQGRIDEKTTTNVGTVHGGSANNVVAAECLVTGEFRSHDLGRLTALKKEIEDALRSALIDDGTGSGSAEVDISWEVNYDGYLVSEDSPQVALALAAAEDLGFEAHTEISNGGADTNILVSYGLAAVSLGCGMELVHSTNEYIAIQDLENLTRLSVRIVEESQNRAEKS